tara:strand:- start:65 stop:565 length:501 start_codon:yes stop_codon:yes gene_type:complete
MFGASFSFIDRGAVRVSKALADFNNFYLTIGIQGPGGLRKYPDSDINVASVAMYQEFGTRSINSRPFLRRTMFEKRAEIEESIREAVTRAIDTGRTVRELAKSGAEIAELVRRTVMSSRSWAKPNAPATIKKKGFDWPLNETGLLAEESISWAVRSKTGKIVKQGS